MRLDKFLCEMKIGSRSQVKTYIRQGMVTVNGKVVSQAETKVEELSDEICFQGQPIRYCKYVYYMLHKPEGVVSATRDDTDQTVVSLLGSCQREDIFPVGRLDKDTTGLLLLTNDGDLAHQMLSPKKHVDKTYLVTVAHPLTKEDIDKLEQGVDIGDKKPTMPARIKFPKNAEGKSPVELLLTIREGRFHQIKRMLQAVGNQVTQLKRVSFGGLVLDEGLKPGEYRALTEEEIRCLCSPQRVLQGRDMV